MCNRAVSGDILTVLFLVLHSVVSGSGVEPGHLAGSERVMSK